MTLALSGQFADYELNVTECAGRVNNNDYQGSSLCLGSSHDEWISLSTKHPPCLEKFNF